MLKLLPGSGQPEPRSAPTIGLPSWKWVRSFGRDNASDSIKKSFLPPGTLRMPLVVCIVKPGRKPGMTRRDVSRIPAIQGGYR